MFHLFRNITNFTDSMRLSEHVDEKFDAIMFLAGENRILLEMENNYGEEGNYN